MTPKYLFHYTKLSTLIKLFDTSKIVSEKDAKNAALTFHATDINSFEDNTEHKLFRKFLRAEKPSISDQLFADAINGKQYVLCFSALENYLPMWHYYADCGRGICLKFNTKELKEAFKPLKHPYEYSLFAPCVYKVTPELQALYDRLKLLYNSEDFETNYFENFAEFIHFQLQAALLKNNGYKYEKEWRLVRSETDYYFKESGVGFIPYAEIKIPLSCMTEIQLGPHFQSRFIYSVERWLFNVQTWTAANFNIKIKQWDL